MTLETIFWILLGIWYVLFFLVIIIIERKNDEISKRIEYLKKQQGDLLKEIERRK